MKATPLLPRLAVIGGAGAILMLALALVVPARGERFYLLAPILFLLDFALFRRRGAAPAARRLGCGAWVALAAACVAAWAAPVAANRPRWPEALAWAWMPCSLGALYTVLRRAWTALPGLRRARGAGGRAASTAAFFILFLPYALAVTNVHRMKLPVRETPAALALPYEDVSLRAADGLALRGWFVPSPGSDTAVLMCHGVGDNRAGLLPYTGFLHQAGFHVFLFDFRGHGESAGHTISFGVREARDVAAAARYLAGRPEVERVLACAFSMGGSALLYAMPDTPEIRGAVIDSTFADFAQTSRVYMRSVLGPLAPLLVPIGEPFLRLELGLWPSEIRPVARVGAVAPRPLLLIHGTADSLVPPEQSRQLFAAAGAPKELWLVEGAGHVAALESAGDEYQRRVVDFLRRAAGQAPARHGLGGGSVVGWRGGERSAARQGIQP